LAPELWLKNDLLLKLVRCSMATRNIREAELDLLTMSKKGDVCSKVDLSVIGLLKHLIGKKK
jgi:hypothetical protein